MSSTYEHATCAYFSAGTCGSCALLGVEAGKRIATKESKVLKVLTDRGISPKVVEAIYVPPSPWGSRCKTKVSVTGTLEAPSLGIVRSDLSTQDLSECPLTPPQVQKLFATLKVIIKEAGLTPYSIQERKGELKHLIVMNNHDGSEGILRFVLRSSEAIPRITKKVMELQTKHPWIRVVSCNIQPIPAAVLEGPEEHILTQQRSIDVHYNDVVLSFMPQSFMQVTHEVAKALYHRASVYVRENSFSHALDLFCGVGGFSLSIASSVPHVTGVEVSPMAVESARSSASRLAASNASFLAEDVEAFLSRPLLHEPDLVIVNPPRRGLSQNIRTRLRELSPSVIVYSSCDPESFARDLTDLTQDYTLATLAPFDMFPMTSHCEVLGILERKEGAG
ncbi:MAG: rRNA (uracil-5-)-methyltransferase RumB [Pseudomonadota bacterium]|jgi:23S rRNA (uracil747-C5)-methyltransferase